MFSYGKVFLHTHFTSASCCICTTIHRNTFVPQQPPHSDSYATHASDNRWDNDDNSGESQPYDSRLVATVGLWDSVCMACGLSHFSHDLLARSYRAPLYFITELHNRSITITRLPSSTLLMETHQSLTDLSSKKNFGLAHKSIPPSYHQLQITQCWSSNT